MLYNTLCSDLSLLLALVVSIAQHKTHIDYWFVGDLSLHNSETSTKAEMQKIPKI